MISQNPAHELRQRLIRAAAELDTDSPVRLLAKRTAPLARAGEPVGTLEVLLRLTFRSDAESRGVLVFEWPDTAFGHSAVAPLAGWVDRATMEDDLQGLLVSCRDAVIGQDAQELPGQHLKVGFPLSDVPEELDGLLDLVCRLGLDKVVLRGIDRAVEEREAARAAALAEPEPVPEPEPVVELEPELELEPEPEVAAPTEPAIIPAPEPVAEAAPEPEPTPSVADARADAIQHNQVFDSKIHPALSVNDEITNSRGETYRLVQKRMGDRRRRVWTRVANNVSVRAARRA